MVRGALWPSCHRATPTNPIILPVWAIPPWNEGSIMKKISLVVVSAAVAIGTAAPASAGVNDPEVIIYRFPSVRDNGGTDNTGVATVFSCTNFSGAQEQIRLVTRSATGTILGNVAFQPLHLETHTFSTHLTAAYPLSSG